MGQITAGEIKTENETGDKKSAAKGLGESREGERADQNKQSGCAGQCISFTHTDTVNKVF